MNKFTKAAIAALVGVASLAPTISSAEAGDWRNDHRRPIYRHNNNDALAAGILGLAAGAIIVGALSDNSPRVIYEEPRRYYRQRPVTVYDYPVAPRRVYRDQIISYSGGLEPWSREWFRYCSNRYRSFNAETGTYRGYDGQNHFCAAN